MKTLIALSSALLLAATAAFATPAAAQYRGGDHDGQRSYQHDRDRDNDRDHRGDYRGRDNDHHGDYRHGERRHDDRRADYRRDDRYGSRSRYYMATRQYVAPRRYIAPPGYRAMRWNVGNRLPRGYYGDMYYVDCAHYGLRPPARGYRWVRVDRDVYMVQAASGVIAEVLFGIFR
jgi:Ni/Co efflux regulator RcnB